MSDVSWLSALGARLAKGAESERTADRGKPAWLEPLMLRMPATGPAWMGRHRRAPKCEVCGKGMLCGQTVAHFSCRAVEGAPVLHRSRKGSSSAPSAKARKSTAQVQSDADRALAGAVEQRWQERWAVLRQEKGL